jgi:tetratricopeptide (TPR) repeat protein
VTVARRARAALVASLYVASVTDARAQPAGRPPAPESAPADDPAAQKQQARDLHARGLALYEAGKLDEAIALFRQAYALAPAPGLLFNIAQAYRAKGPDGCAEALQYYRTYFDEAPAASNRDFVAGRILDMEACERARPRPPARTAPGPAANETPPPPPEAPATARASLPWGPLVLGGIGVAAGVTGLVLYLTTHDEFLRLERACPDGRCPRSTWEADAARQQIGVAVGIAGAAALVAAFAWWLLTPAGASMAQRR